MFIFGPKKTYFIHFGYKKNFPKNTKKITKIVQLTIKFVICKKS